MSVTARPGGRRVGARALLGMSPAAGPWALGWPGLRVGVEHACGLNITQHKSALRGVPARPPHFLSSPTGLLDLPGADGPESKVGLYLQTAGALQALKEVTEPKGLNKHPRVLGRGGRGTLTVPVALEAEVPVGQIVQCF